MIKPLRLIIITIQIFCLFMVLIDLNLISNNPDSTISVLWLIPLISLTIELYLDAKFMLSELRNNLQNLS